MTFFERIHDQSLVPRCPFRCSSIICVFFLYLIWLDDQNEAFGLRIHPFVIFLECFQKYGIRYGRIRYVDMSLDQKWNGFFLPTHFFTKVLYFDTEWHGMNVSNRMKRLFVHLGISSKPWNIFHYPCIGCKKVKLSSTNIRKNQHGHFLVHNNQFSSNPLTQGLDLRPTDRIRLFDVTQRSDLRHKIISVDGLRVTDLARELISEFSEVLYERK